MPEEEKPRKYEFSEKMEWCYCEKHDLRFPCGEQCPRCKEEERK